MSHYAKVVNNIVTQVIVAEAEFFDTFVDTSPGEWIKTSYSGSFRKNYAGIGYVYDVDRDAFYAPQPYPSWSLNETTYIWESPVAYPDDDLDYDWDETSLKWVEIKK